MSYSKIILQDSADIVWPLDDIDSSSSVSKAINFFNNNDFSYSASINTTNSTVIENPIIFGGGTSLRLTSSAVGISIPALNRFSEVYSQKNSCISFWMQLDTLNSDEHPIFKKRNYENNGLFIKDNYLIYKYGNSASYIQVYGDITNYKDPLHVVIGQSPSNISITINGVLFNSKDLQGISLPEDVNHDDNNYIDFYGPKQGSWIIDSISFFPNILSSDDAKRHYVYGLGKNIGEDIFYSRGGEFYNFTTIDTERILNINWTYPQEWRALTLNDLNHKVDGIQPLIFEDPDFFYYSDDILTASNSISFRTQSGSAINASYIDIDNLYNKLISGKNPFFIKVKLDGPKPKIYEKQKILVYGEKPDREVFSFNLFNNNNSYEILVETYNSASVSFNISDIDSQPDLYLGMSFDGISNFFYAESGSAVQTASFNNYDSEGFGLDPLSFKLPPRSSNIIRIGSELGYDSTNYNINFPDVKQFNGSFKSFFVHEADISNLTDFSYLDNYKKHRYKLTYSTDLSRFKISTYGNGEFNVHAIDMGEFINDSNQILGSNIINIGYPDIVSSSNVLFYATEYNYSGSVVNTKTRLSQNNYLPFINNKNISGDYIKFEFEIYSEDSLYFPPKIKYFNMETFKSTNNSTVLRNESGSDYTLYPSSSSVYLPEIKKTPSIFINNNSGIKLYESYADFSENISPKPLDPRTIEGLRLWLDSRFVNGLEYEQPSDDTRVLSWSDLSGIDNNAIQDISASAPVFRVQSLNLLRLNQLNGSEDGDLSFIQGGNSNIESSNDGYISENKSIKIIPNGTGNNSYADISFNTASINVFANQSYTVVGTITLEKIQTASSLNSLSRKIVVYDDDGASEIFSASSIQSDNLAGSYSLSATFTTSSATKFAKIRLYNGSYSEDDPVYWDNIGLYSVSDVTGSRNEWVSILTENDSPTIKFDGNSTFLSTSASALQPFTMYVVGRAFNDGVFIGYSASGASIFSYDGSYYVDSGTSASQVSATNEFNIYTIEFNSGSAKLYLNGMPYYKVESGRDSIIDGLLLGKGNVLGVNSLSGDISAVLLYEGTHNYLIRSNIETWLDESFNLIHTVLPLTPADDVYLDEYTERYPLLPWL